MHTPPPCLVGLSDASISVDDPAGREIRARNYAQQSFQSDLWIVDDSKARVDGFGKIVWRNIGRHTHRNTR